MAYIKLKNISKGYKIYKNKYGRLLEWIFPFIKKHEMKWILRDIEFTIGSGDSVGIIGSNGAGKSTLLKIISGAISKTKGELEVSGTIAALLELGIGFNLEFTGRENIYSAGQLQGLSKKSIEDLIPSIERFSEIGSYIDQPVRIYSSGMLVRLAFSISTAVRPDILIVDEALAVGDISFQQKCYNRIKNFKEQGSIILFVTHDLGTVYNLCDRAIYIHDQKIKSIGDVRSVAKQYERDLKGITQQEIKSEINSDNILIKAELRSSSDNEIKNNFSENEDIILKIYCENSELDEPHLGFQIRDAKNNIIYETNSSGMIDKIELIKGYIFTEFHLKNNLSKGTYTISFGLANKSEGRGVFNKIILDQVSPIKFTIYRDTDELWSGFSNMRAK